MAKVALEDAKRGTPAAQLFGGRARRMSPNPIFPPSGDSALVASLSPAPSAGRRGATGAAAGGGAPCDRPGPPLCLSP